MDFLSLLLGYIYMWLRYGNREKIDEILRKDYNNNYAEVGFFIVSKPLMIIFLFLVASLIIGAIISTIKFGISD